MVSVVGRPAPAEAIAAEGDGEPPFALAAGGGAAGVGATLSTVIVAVGVVFDVGSSVLHAERDERAERTEKPERAKTKTDRARSGVRMGGGL